jgi:hypothetical protein
MKHDGDEEYKDPEDSEFVPTEGGDGDEFLDDDLLLDDLSDDLVDDDLSPLKDDDDKIEEFDSL